MSELQEKASQALLKCGKWDPYSEEMADAVLDLVIDECMKVAHQTGRDKGHGKRNDEIVAAIRALHPKEPQRWVTW